MWGFLVLFSLLFCLKIFCNKKKIGSHLVLPKSKEGLNKTTENKTKHPRYGEQANWKSTQRPKLEQVEQKENK